MRWRRIATGMVVVLVAALSVGLNADLHSPPRYDGAGYSVLALSLIKGRGYREIDRPDAPRHAHFPPGYPLALAGLWRVFGPSVMAAHLFSMVCTVAASWLAWRWLRRIEPRHVADAIGIALAVNWMWGAVGGAIQSEGMYLFLSMLAIDLARGRAWLASLALGILLGLCVLTRHAGIGLLLAVVIDRLAGISRARWKRLRDVAVLVLAAAAVIGPWIYWLATVRRNTQVALLESGGLPSRIASQTLFYARRIPDALTGPFVEVATVFSRSRILGPAMTVIAMTVSASVLIGLVRCVMNPRRRLAGLVPLVTLPLLLVWPFTEAGRFLIPLVPFLLVGAVQGLAWILRLVSPGQKLKPRRLAVVLVLLVAIPYPGYALLARRSETQRRTHADFDAACAWIAREAKRPGPVLTRHPGEVFWQTGRLAIVPVSDDSTSLVKQIQDDRVAYVLVDSDRFANASPTPLGRLVAERPDQARRVFGDKVQVYEVTPDSAP